MTTAVSRLSPIKIMAGVCPPTDATPSSTPHFTAATHIRFYKGRPQKLGGWRKITLNGSVMTGVVRSIYSAVINDKVYTVLGSNEKLYANIGSEVVNITPLTTTTVAIPNSLATNRNTLGNNPLSTVVDTNEVHIVDANAASYNPGDLIILSGATGLGGITAGQLNTSQIVRSKGPGFYTIKVPVNATSTATGGGAAVVRSSGLVTVTKTAHGLTNGDRIGISGATAFGGITTLQINMQNILRNVTTNTFDIMTDGIATSAVTAAGGTGTVYAQEIPDGLVDQNSGQGYGMGRYGVGLYGTALVSAGARRYPRIWFFDSFGDNIIATAGNQTGVYQWGGDTVIAPTLVPNAPTTVNYAFVSDNILVTFGAGNVANKIFSSDQADITEWVASSTNQVFEDNIEGAGKLISHLNVDGVNLIFSNAECYTFEYIGLPDIWGIHFKDDIGIIGPMARVVAKGVGYFMGPNNFYRWKGGNIEIVPSNTSSESTILNYVFGDINRGQQYKSFAWYNQQFDEIWYHYPSAGSNEPDRVARQHVGDGHWTPDTLDRLAAEYPNLNLSYPRLIDSLNNFFRHEIGVDADTQPMAWSLTSNTRDLGTDNVLSSGIVPDSIQTGDITFKIDAFSYPQSPNPKNTKEITVESDTEQIALDIDGRFLRYTLSGSSLGQQWIMGDWLEPLQESARSE